MLPAINLVDPPYSIALILLMLAVFAGVWRFAMVQLRNASGWQLLSEFFCDRIDQSGGESIGVSMARSEKASAGISCRALLDAEEGHLILQVNMMAGSCFTPLKIPLSRFLPARSVMWAKGFRVETGDPKASVLFLFDEAFTKRLAAAIDDARG